MKPLIELFQESTEIKSEINVLILQSNDPENPLEERLSLLSKITLLHTKLNKLLKEITDRRANKSVRPFQLD